MKYLKWMDLNYPQINNLTIDVKGVEKLLTKVKVNKA